MNIASGALRRRAAKAIEEQKAETVTPLSCLLAVEDELGYIPPEAAEEVARVAGVTINDVWGVASFYANFRFEPPGRSAIEVCWGPTCFIKGAMQLAERALDKLGLDGEGTTADGAASFRFNTCLGACANAPVISVNHKLAGRMKLEDVDDALAGLSEEKGGLAE